MRKNTQNMIQNERLMSLFMHYTNPKKYPDSGSFLVGKDVTQLKKMLGAFLKAEPLPPAAVANLGTSDSTFLCGGLIT
jgi:hypothetical protein